MTISESESATSEGDLAEEAAAGIQISEINPPFPPCESGRAPKLERLFRAGLTDGDAPRWGPIFEAGVTDGMLTLGLFRFTGWIRFP